MKRAIRTIRMGQASVALLPVACFQGEPDDCQHSLRGRPQRIVHVSEGEHDALRAERIAYLASLAERGEPLFADGDYAPLTNREPRIYSLSLNGGASIDDNGGDIGDGV